jgi:hypothetical protein
MIDQTRKWLKTSQSLLASLAVVSLLWSACTLPPETVRPSKRYAYSNLPATEWSFPEREDEMDILIAAFDPRTGAGTADQIKARFRGKDRAVPKTTIAEADIEEFANLDAFIATLPEDDEMRNLDPPLRKDSMSRFTQEKRNVQVRAWIYAIKYEADQDWHLILGTDPAHSTTTYFNAEISGLPSSSAAAFDTLLNVRKQLSAILDDELPGGGSYRKYEDPIPVIVQGSLFYDIDHAPGIVGPAGMRPKTAWEIHPVTNIDLIQ